MPHFFLRVLADRQLRPAALRLMDAGKNDFETILAHPGLPPLLQVVTCFVVAEDAALLTPENQAAATQLGLRIAAPGFVAAHGSSPPQALPQASSLVCSDWYMQPLVQPVTDRTGSRSAALHLMQLVANDAETREIEEVFRHAPALSYHLLRIVNSPAIGTGRQITSFSQAIVMLGRNQLRRWLNLILFASRDDDPRGPMLLARAATRASMLEQLARQSGQDREGQERAFMAGMFSLLGVMFGLPLDEVIGPLRLAPEVADALLERRGELGALLACVEAIERGDAEQLGSLAGGLGEIDCDLDQLQIDAHLWMLSVLGDSRGQI